METVYLQKSKGKAVYKYDHLKVRSVVHQECPFDIETRMCTKQKSKTYIQNRFQILHPPLFTKSMTLKLDQACYWNKHVYFFISFSFLYSFLWVWPSNVLPPNCTLSLALNSLLTKNFISCSLQVKYFYMCRVLTCSYLITCETLEIYFLNIHGECHKYSQS